MLKSKALLIPILLILISLTSAETIVKDNYVISKNNIERTIQPGELFQDQIKITNKGSSELSISVAISGDASSIITIKNTTLSVSQGSSENLYFVIKGLEGEYDGTIKLSGGVMEEIPIKIEVTNKETNAPFLLEISPIKNTFDISKNISFQTNFQKIQEGNIENVSVKYNLISENNTILMGSELMNISSSTSFIKEFQNPEAIQKGQYSFQIIANYSDIIIEDQTLFNLKIAFLDIKLFGFLSMKLLIWILSFIIIGIATAIIIKKRIDAKKKYKMSIDLKTIPKPNKDYFFLGKIAEKNYPVYLDPGRLTTHSIVAGATGGGKSITAQVIVEEALMHNIAVIVFDPTAQWSGMLRKCTDKKMMSFYPKFNLKPKDARAFKGNVRMIKNARQVIDLNKFINPGEIQIFSLNKLDPKDMDIFVASVIRQIFRSDPKEYPSLKVLFVFDEVHRLLPKFGGSGEGFLQIERGCREFRKWGLGIMLVSQVLNDFVGSIKANISTEAQMRTRDEGDLNRIKTKHGEEFLQSLVKASSGVGLFGNPAYNHAHPYFVNFRPILHNTKRLTDEELEEYNKYNDQVDDIEFQIEELEKEKVDTFDLKMELKLIKDKIMSGSFSVVEIYLEGLSPRVKKEWEKLGKQPPERKLELISEEEIQKSIQEAKQKHEAEKSKEESVKKEEEKASEKIEEKIVKSITFDNGAMISSIKEMREYLPSMADEDFNLAVNEKANKILSWVKENFDETISKILEGKLKKEEIISALNEVGKSKEAPKEDGTDKSK